MKDLSGKIVVITGAGAGLGWAYAERVATLGASVAVADIDGDAARRAAEQLQANGTDAQGFAVDVANDADVRSLVRGTEEQFGRIDVLINNAGGLFAPWGPMDGFSLAQWDRAIAVNLTGTWLCSQAAVPGMKRRGAGKIINVSTTMVAQGTPSGAAPYVAAKAGVVGLTRALAKELGPFGITVNAVAPGLIPMNKAADPERAPLVAQLVETVVAQQAVGRVGVPDDLCGAVEFLASDDSNFISGQVLNVDGGWALS